MRTTILLLLLSLALVACSDGGTGTPDAGTGVPDAPTETDAGPPDAGTTFTLPALADACDPFAIGTGPEITAMGVADVAAAAAGDSVGIAFVDRQSDGSWLARFAVDDGSGAPITPVDLGSVGSTFPVGAGVASDGASVVVCASGMDAGLICWHSTTGASFVEGVTIAGASRPALAFGAGGYLLVYETATGLVSQALAGDATLVGDPHPLASGAGRGAIAPTADGYVVGYADSSARALLLDAAGSPSGTAMTLGPARSRTDVAITFAAGAIGASWIGTSGDAMAAVAGFPAVTVGPGASGYGRVGIAPAANGVVATWSDFSGFLGVATLDASGVMLGTASMIGTSWDDNAHALATTPSRIVVAVAVFPSGAPIELHDLECVGP